MPISKDQITDAVRLAIHRPSALVCRHRIPMNAGCPECQRRGPKYEPEPLKPSNDISAQPSKTATVPLTPIPAQDSGRAPKKAQGLSKPRGRRKMNGVEAAYALIMEAEKQRGDWLRYGWEELTLRWPDGMAYTPDFMALAPENDTGPSPAVVVWLIETKGPYIEPDALVKFRAARAHWPEFNFKMMQRSKSGSWTQLL